MTGRTWTLAHNGTIFEGDLLNRYYIQNGTTDSERILLYLIDQIDSHIQYGSDLSDIDIRAKLIEDGKKFRTTDFWYIKTVTRSTKVSLMNSITTIATRR
ncbi:MAG: class II glutamine amidotransferase [Saccharofermentans sp.]|nr:class II glutamine amidotransferase [Saccharofermentans sp.]